MERRLPALTNEIELRGTEMAKYLIGIVPLQLLYSMEIVPHKYRDRLSSWNHDLTERAKILDSQIRQLDGLSKIWRTTLQLPELSSAAPESPQRVQNIIELIDRTQRRAQSLQQRDLILQGHVLETKARLQAITPAFEQAQVNAANNLFVQDSPPYAALLSNKERRNPGIAHTAGQCRSTQDLPPTRARPPLSSRRHYFRLFSLFVLATARSREMDRG